MVEGDGGKYNTSSIADACKRRNAKSSNGESSGGHTVVLALPTYSANGIERWSARDKKIPVKKRRTSVFYTRATRFPIRRHRCFIREEPANETYPIPDLNCAYLDSSDSSDSEKKSSRRKNKSEDEDEDYVDEDEDYVLKSTCQIRCTNCGKLGHNRRTCKPKTN